MPGPIEGLLQEAAKALKRRSCRFAIIGGIAISVRVEPRFTRDLDLVVAVSNDREAEQLALDLQFEFQVIGGRLAAFR